MPVALSRRAEADLEEIVAFTVERWGEAQAERYVAMLTDAERLRTTARPVAGEAGLFRAAVASHFVFFRAKRGELFVVRFLHRRSNVLRHLR